MQQKKNKRVLVIVIAVVVVLGLAAGIFFATKGSNGSGERKSITINRDNTVINHEGIEEGAILHAFCWNFNTIKENMKDIADAGFTAVQTSPINECLDTHPELAWMGSNGAWYYHYQPTDWKIGNYQLGTRDEFITMCEEADKYGIGVIVDILPNHTTPSKSKVSKDLINAVGSVTDLYHHRNSGCSDYANRLQCTRYDVGGLPDVDTENEAFQQYFFEFLLDCVACGADGFRIDTAKHIGLPDDDRPDGVENTFYPNMKKALDDAENVDYADLFVYGEVLQGENERLAAYQDMIGGTTASKYGANIRSMIENKDLSVTRVSDYQIADDIKDGVTYEADPDKLVTWVESHDTYMNNGESWVALDDEHVKLGWAIIAARKDGTPLFFNRPAGSDRENREGINQIGPAGNDYWKDDEVVAVNRFRLAMSGKDEFLSNPGQNAEILMIERGDAADKIDGAVIINSTDAAYVIDEATGLADGTYMNMTDDDNVYVVSGGKIHGVIPACQVVVLTEKEKKESVCVNFYNNAKWDEVNVIISGSQESVPAYSYGDGWWTVNVSKKEASVLFTDGTNNSESYKVKDFGDKAVVYLQSEGATVYDTKAAVEDALGIESVAVYFLNSGFWDGVNAYVWNGDNQILGGWPGAATTYCGDYWYRADFTHAKGETFNIIFNNGDDKQTCDMTVDDMSKNYVTYSDETKEYATYASETEAEEAIEFSTDFTYVYFYNSEDWEEVAAYTWGGDNSDFGKWPGSKDAVIDDGNGWFKVRLDDTPGAALYIIFNDNGKGAQTSDININDMKKVYIDFRGLKYTSKKAVEDEIANPTTSTTVHFYNNEGWDEVSAYIWGSKGEAFGGWPGTPATDDGDGWWSAEVPCTAAEGFFIIFNNNNNGKQTADLEAVDQEKVWCYMGTKVLLGSKEEVEAAAK